jgi:hypothetical protein
LIEHICIHMCIGMLTYLPQMLHLSARYPLRVATDIIRQMAMPDHHRALLVCYMLPPCYMRWHVFYALRYYIIITASLTHVRNSYMNGCD